LCSMNGRERSASVWAEKAEHDLSAVRTLADAPDAPWDIVVFHAQQAAEKYLKALLVDHDKVVPKIHDLERLLDLCVLLDEALPRLSTECRRLTQLGFASRYPDSPQEPSEDDAREAMGLADRVCDAVRPRIRRPKEMQ
jgi:HEPN domain-containing protein